MVFTATTNFTAYEAIQSAVFEHVAVTAIDFGLRLFNDPSGTDVTTVTLTPTGIGSNQQSGTKCSGRLGLMTVSEGVSQQMYDPLRHRNNHCQSRPNVARIAERIAEAGPLSSLSIARIALIYESLSSRRNPHALATWLSDSMVLRL